MSLCNLACRDLDCHCGSRGTEWGFVVTWGEPDGGGDSSRVAAQLSSGVQSVTGSLGAFAAVKSDGSVVAWGNREYGGDSRDVVARGYRGTE